MALKDLLTRRCVPCEGGVPKLDAAATRDLLAQLDGWQVRDEKLHKTIQKKDFRQAMAFLNRVADIAETEGHHPDFCVHYNRIDFTIWTHAIGGLSENDFILAAKIDAAG